MGDKNIKQIIINPELFEVSNRKRKGQTPKERIKINNTVSRTPKSKILRHIQKIYNQERKQKKEEISKNILDSSGVSARFNNELEESINFLLDKSKNNGADADADAGADAEDWEDVEPVGNMQKGNKNVTAKRYVPNEGRMIDNGQYGENVDLFENMQEMDTSVVPIMNPVYGCLKRGKLPTFSQYRKTLKNPRDTGKREEITFAPAINISPLGFTPPVEKRENDGLKQFLGVKPAGGSSNSSAVIGNKKKRKIIRRTFKLGKSKKDSSIGVLISNKTIRNKINLKMKDIYEEPIVDIKQFLLKKGLIKVGSTAPNEILREMYKNVIMLCGDLQNHNTENMLFNYLNAEKKE